MTEVTAPITAQEATTQLIAMNRTRDADPAARAALEAIESGAPAAATPAPAAAPAATVPAVDTAKIEAARAELKVKANDREFVAKYLSGDAEAKATMLRIHQRADPGESFDGKEIPGIEGGPMSNTLDASDQPPARPEKYELNTPHSFAGDVGALHKDFREIAFSAGIPASLTSHLYSAAHAAAERITASGKPLSEIDVVRAARSTEARLRSAWGDRYEVKLASARSVLRALPEAKYKMAMDLLGPTGILNDQHIIMRLADFAERRAQHQSRS